MPGNPEPFTDAAAAEVKNFRLIRALTPDHTFLCSDASGNLVVLVRLEEDCLHRGVLHPSIRDRLAHLRGLPHPQVAALRGVERWSGAAFMVWVYLDGETWDDFLCHHPESFPTLAGSLAASLLSLQNLSAVHGNLHGRNIIVRLDGHAWLTQFSPYLYTDRSVDVAAFTQLLAAQREFLSPLAQSRLDELISQLDAGKTGLKEASQMLLKLNDPDALVEIIPRPRIETSYRRSSLASAIAIALIAVITAAAVFHHFANHADAEPARTSTGSIRTFTPKQ